MGNSPRHTSVVVIGASAGGVDALSRLAAALPADFQLPVFVVLHVPPTLSLLPEILSRAGPIPAVHARDADEIVPGRIVIAPPSHHLLVGQGTIHLNRGPRENGHRPAVDPLFRSAAAAHGAGVVAIVLSGALDDGALGAASVQRAGGLVVVQDPREAPYPAMPTSALAATRADHVLPLDGIAELLVSLDRQGGPDPAQSIKENDVTTDPTELNPQAVTASNRENGEVTAFTCPECSGTLWEIRESDVVTLRCRVGHAYSEESYSQHKAVTLEGALWTAVTALVEKADFSKRLAARMRRSGQEAAARRYDLQAQDSLAQSELVRSAVAEFVGIIPDEEAQAS